MKCSFFVPGVEFLLLLSLLQLSLIIFIIPPWLVSHGTGPASASCISIPFPFIQATILPLLVRLYSFCTRYYIFHASECL